MNNTIKHLLNIVLLMIISGVSLRSYAFPEQCLTSPSRATPCEHLIYKRIVTEQSKEVVCVCLQDFQDLIYPASTPEKVKEQNEKFEQLSKQFNLDVDALKQLIQY